MQRRPPLVLVLLAVGAAASTSGCTSTPPVPEAPSASARPAEPPHSARPACEVGAGIVSASAPSGPTFLSVVTVSTSPTGQQDVQVQSTDEDAEPAVAWPSAPPAGAEDALVISAALEALSAKAAEPLTASPESLTGGFTLDAEPFTSPGEFVLYAYGTPATVAVNLTCDSDSTVATVSAVVDPVAGALECGLPLPPDATEAHRAHEWCAAPLRIADAPTDAHAAT